MQDALSDTGASIRSCSQTDDRRARTENPYVPATPADSEVTSYLPMYGTVRLTIQGRDCPVDVGEIGDEYPVLVGQIPLEVSRLGRRHQGTTADRKSRPRRRVGRGRVLSDLQKSALRSFQGKARLPSPCLTSRFSRIFLCYDSRVELLQKPTVPTKVALTARLE